MAIESMSQLVQHASNNDDIAERCVAIVTLWAHYYEKLEHHRHVHVHNWALETEKAEPLIRVNYRAWNRAGSLLSLQSWFPAMYLFMPIEDVEADIKKRRREYDKEIRKARKEDARKDQEKHDAWIEQEYAKLMERRNGKHKKGKTK